MTTASFIALPLGFGSWPPAVQAAALAGLTLISEDLTTVGTALLAAANSLLLGAGFWGCFLGIWLGDAGLYGLARGAGRPLLARPWARKFFRPARVAQSELW